MTGHLTFTDFYKWWAALHQHIGELDTHLRHRIRGLETSTGERLDNLERKAFRMALDFAHIHQAVGTLESTWASVQQTLTESQERDQALADQVKDLLARIASGDTTPEDAQKEWSDAQADLDAVGGELDTLGTHMSEALEGAKAVLPPQGPNPVLPNGDGGVPDAPVQPVAPQGAVASPDTPTDATPTPGNAVTGLGGVSVNGVAADPSRPDGTVTTAISTEPAPSNGPTVVTSTVPSDDDTPSPSDDPSTSTGASPTSTTSSSVPAGADSADDHDTAGGDVPPADASPAPIAPFSAA